MLSNLCAYFFIIVLYTSKKQNIAFLKALKIGDNFFINRSGLAYMH